MPVSYSGTAITWPDSSTTTSGWTGFKNRIINGAMMIDQRNAGASVTPTADIYTLDRWLAGSSVTSKYSVQQNAGSVTPPVGFTNYLGVTSLSSYSLGSSDFFYLSQKLEGFNTADLGFGTANASTITFSFWVRSSLTGTFGGFLRNSANNRFYPYSYTISSANTWEQKAVTIAGDTTGTWVGATNGVGLEVSFNLGIGSALTGTANAWTSSAFLNPTGATSVVGTNGATFYITGVQLERGSTASSFEYRPYGTELQLCQRYYQKNYNQNVAAGASSGTIDSQRSIVTYYAGNEYTNAIYLYQTMRAIPSISLWSDGGTSNQWTALPSTSNRTVAASSISDCGFMVYTTGTTSDGSLQGMWAASAEL